MTALRLPFHWIAWRLHWSHNRDLLDAARAVAVTPRPPAKGYKGERADNLRERVGALIDRYTLPLETPEWMLPANVDEFLARTRPGA